MISRRSHHALNTPAYAGAPTERCRYAPSIPHCSPMMKQSDRITTVEPTIRIPAWRSASPKNLKTRPRSTSPKTRAKNLVMSPNEAIQSRGTASQPIIVAPLPGRLRGRGRPGAGAMYSLDHADFRVGRQERLREHVVEREHA